jgi:histidine ammonia-lyase
MAARSAQPVTLDGRSLTSAGVSDVARGEAPVVLAADARARNAAAAEVVGALLARGTPVYGVTTGVGPFRSRAVSTADRSDHQLRLLPSHAAGAGRPLSPPLVRAAMAVRAKQLGAGGGGISDELLGALIDALNAGVVSFARELGSLRRRSSRPRWSWPPSWWSRSGRYECAARSWSKGS